MCTIMCVSQSLDFTVPEDSLVGRTVQLEGYEAAGTQQGHLEQDVGVEVLVGHIYYTPTEVFRHQDRWCDYYLV